MSDNNMADTAVDLRQHTPPPPAPVRAEIDLGGRTHPGKVRENNEDNFHAVRFGRYLRTLLSSLPPEQVPEEVDRFGFAIAVADGMGGQAAGEVASRMAITLLLESALNTSDWVLGREEPDLLKVMNRATQRFQEVNDAVVAQAKTGPGQRGMGTTLSLTMSLGDDLIVTHVGDSPVYLFHQGELHRLTRDHTVAQQWRATLSPADAARLRHVLTRAIGVPEAGGEPDVYRHKLADGDRLLLCTDGLTDMVDDESIARELGRGLSADATCQALVDLALEHGGRDNVTVVVATYSITPQT